jgi:peptidyl-prolyl cis-trans isomerase A (cyclophilin A)
MRKFLYCLLLFVACNTSKKSPPHIEIQTAEGDIEIELYDSAAPKTVAAFLSYVDADLYRNSSFYRVLNEENQPSNAPKAELIQGGIWKSDYNKSQSLPRVPHEPTSISNLKHVDGTISLARLEPGTGGSEFFICIGDQPGFDFGGKNNPDGQGYAAFGKVTRGMDIVKRIYNHRENEQSFDPPVIIYKIVRL